MEDEQRLNSIMENIINQLYAELTSRLDNNVMFPDIDYFEANGIGKIGEKFFEEFLKSNNIQYVDNTITHNQYDFLIKLEKKDIKIEVKTARLGINNTFQFNSVNPNYSYDWVICIGISRNKLYFQYFSRTEDIKQDGYKLSRDGTTLLPKYFLSVKIPDNTNSQPIKIIKLVGMTTKSTDSYKITLRLPWMFSITKMNDFLNEIRNNE